MLFWYFDPCGQSEEQMLGTKAEIIFHFQIEIKYWHILIVWNKRLLGDNSI